MVTKRFKIKRAGLDRRARQERRRVTLSVRRDRRVGERRVLLRRIEDILRHR